MKNFKMPEVDTWNYIHNINYLLSNCAEDGRYNTLCITPKSCKNACNEKEKMKVGFSIKA
jgi:hypothetical protein